MEHEGWKDLQNILEGIEQKSYVNLGLPQIRDNKDSLEYWVGKQNGRIELVAEIRNELGGSIRYLESINPKKEENSVDSII